MSDNKPKEIPTNLTHKPIYAINDYEKIDGNYKTNTDVVGISIGKAQWDENNFVPAVKVWRYKNRWSRQSEETTVTRALDMATLVVNVLNKSYNDFDFSPYSSVFGKVSIEQVSKNQDLVRELNEYLKEHKADIECHIELLKKALADYEKHNNC